ncbi:hypothetical protein GIB67_035919 [Kingdonia uniflora]|uniref:C3H1-type domain-containing protein n=1 Tax=Kingdonia uniflora TaxID=39325 RepID=A0A7J7N1B0_9MAGN|nr:hypothetical protein GIB67_035919 [Kingdonia uniflora]
MKGGSRDSAQTTTIVEDEVMKRNTDCVYFLASPLTCKKGNECEYRHSEEARMNPRDCWFWLNGNCLNAKCSFRHPPLDGLLGTTAANHAKAAPPPPSQTAAAAQVSAVYTSGKQGTPCYYFQQGLCLKGERCHFMHLPQPFDKPVPQPLAPKMSTTLTEPYVPTSVTEPHTVRKTFGSLEKCTQAQPKVMQGNFIRREVPQLLAKPPTEFVMASPSNNGLVFGKAVTQPKNGLVFGKTVTQPKNGVVFGKTVTPPPVLLDNDHLRYKPIEVSSVAGGNSLSRIHRTRQSQPLDDHRNFRSGKEPDEFVGESSPGFDVLVDDELQDSDFYQNEDEFRRNNSRERRHLENFDEFDHVRSSDYGSAKFGREKFSDPRAFDVYGRVQDHHGWEQRRTSSERNSERGTEKRGFQRAESPDNYDESDLRYRLSKHRKINGSRSAVSPDRRGDRYRRDDRGRHAEDSRYRGPSRRESQSRHLVSESSISNRLQGRISIPGRSSPESNHNNSHPNRDMDRGRNWGRLSPVKPLPTPSYQGRIQDRIKRREEEDYTTEARHFRRRDEVEAVGFTVPKSLSQLGERINARIGKFMGNQEPEGSTSFEGPKPFSLILKRKREGKASSSGDGEEYNEKDGGERLKTVFSETTSDNKPFDHQSHSSGKEETRSPAAHNFGTNDKNLDDEDEEGLIRADEEEVAPHETLTSAQEGNDPQTEETLMEEDQELQNYDQNDDEYDYENGEDLEEYYEEDEEDAEDFAKRVGVMLS